jgi:hypothetical protein
MDKNKKSGNKKKISPYFEFFSKLGFYQNQRSFPSFSPKRLDRSG